MTMTSQSTVRSALDHKKRLLMILVLIGSLIAVGGVVLAQLQFVDVEPYYAVLPGAILFTLTLLYANIWGLRCPRCGGSWGTLAMQSTQVFSINTCIRYCPFCGCDIDKELSTG
jgi:hypothetical protein